MRGSRKFCQRGSNFDNFFFMRGESKYHYKRTISASEMAFRFKLRFAGVLMSARWRGSFVFFRGSGPELL